MTIDLAVIGGGVAGTAVADAMLRARPDWSIALFERTDRIGGRLRSLQVDGLDHPIELGGMRFLTSHRRVADLVEEFGLPTHPFDPTGGAPEHLVVRGVAATGPEADAGRGYDLRQDQQGRTFVELATYAFDQIVPGFQRLDHEGHVRWRKTGRLMDRPVTDWAIGDAFEALLGSEGRRFVTDAFGYDSGPRAFCAPDFVEFLFDGGDPGAEARTPDAGMQRIPHELAARFQDAGGEIRLGHELASLAIDDGAVALAFADGATMTASRVVLATPQPALRRLATQSRVLQGPLFEDVFGSVEGFPAMKLYIWYERAWWRPGIAGIRTTTDLPIRKVFYFDGGEGSNSAIIGMYTDGRDVRPWVSLYEGGGPGAPAPAGMLAEVHRQLQVVHPDGTDIPAPVGSALMYWGGDPLEVGWHFWRAGVNSDDILQLAVQPDASLPIYLANEAFSRRQSWVEGALEAASAAVEQLLGISAP